MTDSVAVSFEFLVVDADAAVINVVGALVVSAAVVVSTHTVCEVTAVEELHGV